MYACRAYSAMKALLDIARSKIRHVYLSSKFPGLRISYPSHLVYDDISSIDIGCEVVIGPYSDIVVLRKTQYSSLEGCLTIGNRVVIGSGTNIRAAGGAISIADNGLLAQNVSLIAANHLMGNTSPYRDLPWDTQRTGVILEENVWVGAGAVLLPGCKVGKNSVIAAGAVVTNDVPANQLWGGIPARLLKVL